MPGTFQQTVRFAGATPRALFDAYLDSRSHSEITGAPARMSARPGGRFRAFGDDGVSGRNLLIAPGRLVVQSWRGGIWRREDADSILVLAFSEVAGGAEIRLVHANVPDAAAKMVNPRAWLRMYWRPMKAWLSSRRVKAPPRKARG